jgi:2-dehydropantoate 2-reductase
MPFESSMPTFAVVGVGAIGSVIGWRLARAGADVLLVARGAHLRHIPHEGLRLTDETGSETLRIAACADAAGQAARDVVVLATKAQDIGAALETAAPLIGADTLVLPAINGLPWWYFKGVETRHAGPIAAVDPDHKLWDALQTNQIIGAVVHMGATVDEPGHVRLAPQPRLVLGAIDGGENGTISAKVSAIASLLTAGGLPTSVDRNIRDAVWSKLLGNLSTNPLSVLTGATLDRLYTEPELLATVRAVMTETLAVGAACGVRFEQDPDSRIAIGRGLGAFRTSMLQDFERGRPLELGAIAQAVLELATRMGIAMPVTRMVIELTQAAERSAAIKRKAT